MTTTPTDTKQIVLLAAAEESYSQAATVLQAALSEMLDTDSEWNGGKSVAMRLHTGLHLLEEAMGAHNRYMDSIK